MESIIFGSIIIGLLGEIFYLTKSHKDEVEKLIRAIIAKNLQDFSQSDILSKVKPNTEIPKDEAIPVEQADESVFKKFLKHTENGGQNELPEV